MANYDQENASDGENAHNMLHTVKLDCDTEKIEMWFQILENKMDFLEIKSQWTKLQVLTSLLSTTPKVLANIESLAALPRASANNNCYSEQNRNYWPSTPRNQKISLNWQ